MSYYDNSQWPASGQAGWEHQTPPTRSGASSAIPREEVGAFAYQIEEVDRAIDNLVKSGKMFGVPGGRREFYPYPGPARFYPPDFDARMGPGAGPRPHAITDYGDSRGHNPSTNLQNFYAAQRHQSSRGSNEAEQMMQAKRRMAAQRERELRNYHQEQQYNRTVLAELSGYGNKPDRTLSPGSMSEDERRELIARQRSALYGDAHFAESATGGFDETGAAPPRGVLPGPVVTQNVSAALRGHSPLTYEYGRTPPLHGAEAPGSQQQTPIEGGAGAQSAGPNQRSRTNSNASPQSNPTSNKGVFDGPASTQQQQQQQQQHKVGQAVAPIGTRPSAAPAAGAANKRSTTPLPSPLSQGYNAPGSSDDNAPLTSGAPSNPSSATADGPGVGLSGWGGRPGVWGNKSGLGVQASVWG
ncbi:hypothetical protein VTK73DRAFT_6890 [Phialemonium thermophilum]|uniref:Uncharacterized protein n=1 Tax=Phialemonium thermophilum TaxID=223376 RepID=A0ABR3WHK0_9PEZI